MSGNKQKCKYQEEVDQVHKCRINSDIPDANCPGLCGAAVMDVANPMTINCTACGQLLDGDTLQDGLADDRERLLAFVNDALQNGFEPLDAVLLVSELSE